MLLVFEVFFDLLLFFKSENLLLPLANERMDMMLEFIDAANIEGVRTDGSYIAVDFREI